MADEGMGELEREFEKGDISVAYRFLAAAERSGSVAYFIEGISGPTPTRSIPSTHVVLWLRKMPKSMAYREAKLVRQITKQMRSTGEEFYTNSNPPYRAGFQTALEERILPLQDKSTAALWPRETYLVERFFVESSNYKQAEVLEELPSGAVRRGR